MARSNSVSVLNPLLGVTSIVMDEGRVVVTVSVVILHLPDATASMDEQFIETTIFRAMRVGEAQVPLAKDAGRVSVLL